MSGRGGVFAARAAVVALLVLLLYVVVGEALQGWVGLHFDVWRERQIFGNERDRREWQRVDRALGFAVKGWPWKVSLHYDAARLQLFAVRGAFIEREDAGEAVLASLGNMRGTHSGPRLVMTAQAHLLRDDLEAFAAAVEALKAQAPHDRVYWHPLVLQTAEHALGHPAFQTQARVVLAHYATFDERQLRVLAKHFVSVRIFQPQPAPKPAAGKPSAPP